ncbi:MAG: multicopper oxidase family protein [Myxococcota bacterium]
MEDSDGLTRRQALIGSVSALALASCRTREQHDASAEQAVGTGEPVAEATLPIQRLRLERTEGAPDGFRRSILTVNGQYPGPILRLKKGQPVTFAIENATQHPAANHWHGQYQLGTWRMDGVPGVTQPAIPPGKTFTTRFTPAPAGTFWYHSHMLLYNGYPDGQYGALLVEDPEVDDLVPYDQESVLIINDWFHRTADEILLALLNPPKSGNKENPGGGDVEWVSALINGKGRYEGGPNVPLETVEVEPGSVTRFRIINASSTYELYFSIDNHDFTVFAADGTPVKPLSGDSLRVPIGARYDLLVKANSSGVHWIRVANSAGQEGLGVLRYKGTAATEPPPAAPKKPSRPLVRSMLSSNAPMTVPDTDVKRFEFALTGSMTPYIWTMSGQRYPVSEEILVNKGDQVRVVLTNKTMMAHPFHLHGHGFWILGDPDNPSLSNRPKVDTVVVPAFGRTAIQFEADNPGKWIFHCHIDWHLATGMARVFRYQSIDNLASNTFPPGTLT